MNEITKLYKNAEIEKCCNNLKKYKSDVCLLNGNIYGRTCNDCMWHHYPPFTAEKQLSLMAFLINRKVGLSFKAEQGEITVEAISRGLAGIVNRIWQDLTEEEQQQIKEILNE